MTVVEPSPTRRKILQHLLVEANFKESEGSSIKDIADTLGLSLNAIRQHLTILETEELVLRRERRGITGRPAIVYYLHENAMDTFPKVYVEFTLDLLEEMEQEFGADSTVDILDRIGVKIADRIIEEMNIQYNIDFCSLPLRERMEYVIKIFDYYGKYPDLIEENNCYAMKNYNCLVYKLTKVNALVCKVDEAILRELFGQPVKKELCLREGDNYCLYRIRK